LTYEEFEGCDPFTLVLLEFAELELVEAVVLEAAMCFSINNLVYSSEFHASPF
jgi:hypothetical protein